MSLLDVNGRIFTTVDLHLSSVLKAANKYTTYLCLLDSNIFTENAEIKEKEDFFNLSCQLASASKILMLKKYGTVL
jgi:hypothetical protein